MIEVAENTAWTGKGTCDGCSEGRAVVRIRIGRSIFMNQYVCAACRDELASGLAEVKSGLSEAKTPS